jgi:hypothetical protein
MAETVRLGLPILAPAQAQKHVTVNEGLARLDALVQLSMVGVDIVVPPVSPAEGEIYGVGVAATGAWTGRDGQIALFLNGGWAFITPASGWQAWSEDAGTRVVFDGAAWIEGAGALSAHGAGFVHRVVEIDHAVSAGATSTVTAALPGGTTVYGVTARVLSALGGVSSLDIGVSGSSTRYGSGIGTAQGSWARGLTGSPLAYYADTDLVLSATGGVFAGTGVIRLAIHVAELSLPRA